MSQSPSKTSERIEKPLTVRPSLSRAAAKFVELHPDEVPRIIESALEAAAVLDIDDIAAPTPALPESLRRLVTSAHADTESEGYLSISEAAQLLGVTRVTIYAWIEAKRLLAWRATRRGMLIPAEQIVGSGKVVPGLERVLAVIAEPAAAWDFLQSDSPFIDPQTLRRPMDALKAGEIDAVVAAAHSFLDAFT